jgi:hypothetical protein
MSRFLDLIVLRSIRYARLMLLQGASIGRPLRETLRKILNDLEGRSPNHPRVPRLSRLYRLE